jgi:RNA recognition motif-containing protein
MDCSPTDCSPAIVSVRADTNDTWFVGFANEVEARHALDRIRNRQFEGKPLRARLKTESFSKSGFRYA